MLKFIGVNAKIVNVMKYMYERSGISLSMVFLGLLLYFVIYIHDLTEVEMSDMYLFADDTKLFKEKTPMVYCLKSCKSISACMVNSTLI